MANPTSKQTRFHYKRCRRYFYLLLKALNEAHNAGVIDYEPKKNDKGYFVNSLPSVCSRVYEAKDNFETATKNQLANAMRNELLKELKGIW